MKKTIATLAVFASLLTSASALSFNWGSSAAIKFDGSNLKNDETVTGYLVYLSSGSVSDVSLNTESTVSTIVSSLGSQVDLKNKTSAMSKISKDFEFDFGSYDNGDAFGMLLVYTGSSDGKTYYNLSSTTYTLSGIADEKSTLEGASFTFSGSTVGESSKLSGGSGWTAVPEPSTAALALAGLALLLKRRKA